MQQETWQSGVPGDGWDQHQTSLGAHFLQTRGWALFQEARGRHIFYASGKNWSWLAILEANRFGSRLYTPYGPTASTPQGLKKAIDSLLSCAAANGVDFIRLEPNSPHDKKVLKSFRARRAHRDIQPKHTLIKDLDRDDEALLADISSTNRRLYRRAQQDGFSFSSSNNPADITLFLDMIHEVAERTGMQPHSDEYFTTMANVLMPAKYATLFVAYHNNKPVATCLAFEDAATRYYAHAANAEHARKLQPSVPLMGYLLFDAKTQGKKHFDFYGVAPPHSENHKWAGLSRFKRSFGGREVAYTGTWEIPIKKTRYQAYRLLRKIRPR